MNASCRDRDVSYDGDLIGGADPSDADEPVQLGDGATSTQTVLLRPPLPARPPRWAEPDGDGGNALYAASEDRAGKSEALGCHHSEAIG